MSAISLSKDPKSRSTGSFVTTCKTDYHCMQSKPRNFGGMRGGGGLGGGTSGPFCKRPKGADAWWSERTNRQLTIYIKHITGPGQGGTRREQWGRYNTSRLCTAWTRATDILL